MVKSCLLPLESCEKTSSEKVVATTDAPTTIEIQIVAGIGGWTDH
ncbi:MAG: hypothetical protein ACYS6K_17905 [Planctomycetota bacterium]